MKEDKSDQERRNERWKFDKTLNIPTMLTVIGLGVSLTSYATKIENKADNALAGVQRVEAVQTANQQTQTLQVQTLRAEIRSDLRDVNAKLDSLLLRLGTGMRNIDSSDWPR